MALFDEVTPEPLRETTKPVKVKHAPDSFKGIAIDTKYVPKSSLLSWINGSNWRVVYYSQILTADQEPTALALDREPAYQQYRKIVDLDIKVSQTLDMSQDDRIRTFSVTGSGHTYPFLTPNLGDMFIANIGDGLLGLFTITSARRETILRDSVYNVEWKMVSKLTDAQVANLDLKSQETLHYNSASLISGCGPFISEQAAEDAKSFSYYHNELVRRFINDFYSPEHSTFLVPDQELKCYDHWLTKFMMAIISISKHPNIRKVRVLNVMSEPVMKRDTFWDAILRKDANLFCYGTVKVGVVSTRISRWRPELQAIGYTGIGTFLYPKEPPYDVDSKYDSEDLVTPFTMPLKEGRSRKPVYRYESQKERNLKWFQFNPKAEGLDRLPIIHPVTSDDFYVLSENFYSEVEYKQSRLEKLVWQYLNKDEIDNESLKLVLKCCLDWDNLERFYYFPVLIALLRTQLK